MRSFSPSIRLGGALRPRPAFESIRVQDSFLQRLVIAARLRAKAEGSTHTARTRTSRRIPRCTENEEAPTLSEASQHTYIHTFSDK